jgi:hypothetical protein
VRLEGLGKLKKSTSSGLDSATFRLVAQCLDQLRYRVLFSNEVSSVNKSPEPMPRTNEQSSVLMYSVYLVSSDIILMWIREN